MSRPKVHSDEELLRLIEGGSLSNDGTWTLKDAAREAGVHPATLVKRFGSRHSLLMTLSRRWVNARPSAPTTDNAHQELLDWIKASASPPDDPGEARAGIAMLLEDIKDEELRALLIEGWTREIDYLTSLIEHATAEGDLRNAPQSTLAATLIFDYVNGAQVRAAATMDAHRLSDPRDALNFIMEGWK